MIGNYIFGTNGHMGMRTKHSTGKRAHDHWIVASPCIVATVVCFYIFAVGLVPSIERHTCEGGRLQWLPSVPGVMTALKIYEWPADLISKLPVAGKVFNMSADFWWELTDPPDTTP
jgi:hypothetical protein